jgi:hypothetical protein
MSVMEERSLDLPEREVVRWRYEEMLRAGYPEAAAIELSRRRYVDLHVACDLLRKQCPAELAFRILL